MKPRKFNIVLICLAACVLAIAALVVIANVSKGGSGDKTSVGQSAAPTAESTPTAEPTPTPTVKPTSTPTVIVAPTAMPVSKPDSKPNVSIPGCGALTISADGASVEPTLKNPEANKGCYNIVYEMRMKDTDEALFTTDAIAAGESRESVNLTRPLEAGIYETYMCVQPYNVEDNSPTNSMRMECTLVVE